MTCAEAVDDATLSDCGCATAGSGVYSRHLTQNNLINDRGDRFEVLLRRHTGMDNCAAQRRGGSDAEDRFPVRSA